MKYFGRPRWSVALVVITWPLTIWVLFPILGMLTLLSVGMFRGMDVLDDFIEWQMDL